MKRRVIGSPKGQHAMLLITSLKLLLALHAIRGLGTPEPDETHVQNCSRLTSVNTSPSLVLASKTRPAHCRTSRAACSFGRQGAPMPLATRPLPDAG
jgi:hypothetical protein